MSIFSHHCGMQCQKSQEITYKFSIIKLLKAVCDDEFQLQETFFLLNFRIKTDGILFEKHHLQMVLLDFS